MADSEPPVDPEPQEPEDPVAKELRRARKTMQLGVGIGLMMAVPFAGYALKHYGMIPSLGTVLSGPEEEAFEERGIEPAAMRMEQVTKGEPRPDPKSPLSLSLIREGYFPERPGRESAERVEAEPIPDEPAEVGLETVEVEFGRAQKKRPPPLDIQRPLRRYPKLRKTKGFYDVSRDHLGATGHTGAVYYPSQPKKNVELHPKSQPVKRAVHEKTPEPEKEPQVKRRPRPKFRRKNSPSGYKDGTVMTGTFQRGSKVGEGGPVSIREEDQSVDAIPRPRSYRRRPPGPRGNGTTSGAPDTAPEPNPEKPEERDGPCPRRGWYKNSITKLCYYSRKACAANAYGRGKCEQPNP